MRPMAPTGSCRVGAGDDRSGGPSAASVHGSAGDAVFSRAVAIAKGQYLRDRQATSSSVRPFVVAAAHRPEHDPRLLRPLTSGKRSDSRGCRIGARPATK